MAGNEFAAGTGASKTAAVFSTTVGPEILVGVAFDDVSKPGTGADTKGGAKAGAGAEIGTEGAAAADIEVKGGFETVPDVEDTTSTVVGCSFCSLVVASLFDSEASSLELSGVSVFFGGPGASGFKNRAGTPIAAKDPLPDHAPTRRLHLYWPRDSFWISWYAYAL